MIPLGFEWVREGRTVLLVRSARRAALVPLLCAVHGGGGAYQTRELAGGRGGAFVVALVDGEVVVRPYRRGGLPAWLLHDTYCGLCPRPFRELWVSETLRQRGAPVVEVYAAAVRWLAPGCYRGWLVTRYVRGARTLWEWASRMPSASERETVLRQAGAAVRRLHDSGGRHPDLHLNNILVCPAAGSSSAPPVVFIDFDRARLWARFFRAPEADLARLIRSAQKLDPAATVVTRADLEALHAAYREGSVCA